MIALDTSQAEKRYRESRANNFAPRERLTIWQWAEREIVLSSDESPFPGPYRSNISPHCRKPMEAITDRRIRIIVLVFPTQSGKTVNLIIIPMAYEIAQDPGPSLLVDPTEPIARSFSESRLQPALLSSPQIRGLMPDDPDKFKLLEMHFEKCTVNLVGSNSPANLSQRPRRYVRGDETDKFPPASVREADALSLALERVKAFWNHKITLTSTPTTEEGNIWRWWRRSNQQHLMIRCPHCRHLQKMIMGSEQEYDAFSDVIEKPQGRREQLYRLKWPKNCAISDLYNRVWYECIKCRGRITEKDRKKALQSAVYKAVNPDVTRIAGFHTNFLGVPWITMADGVVEFLASKKYPDQLKNFFNSWLALPWNPTISGTDTISLAGILERSSVDQTEDEPKGYMMNTCPEGVIFLTGGIDVQAHEVWYSIRGWGLGDRSWLISYGKIEVETDDEEEFLNAVKKIIGRDYGRPLILSGIDSGWGMRTSAVYMIARALPGLVCIKGRRSNVTKSSDGKDLPIPAPKRIDKMPDGKPLPKGPLHYSPSRSYWNRWMMGRVNARPRRWYWPDGLQTSKDGMVYIRHMESEREVTRRNKNTGVTVTEWITRKGYEGNHLFDCEYETCVAQEIALTAGGAGKKTMEQAKELADRLMGKRPAAAGSTDTPGAPRKPQRRRRRRSVKHM